MADINTPARRAAMATFQWHGTTLCFLGHETRGELPSRTRSPSHGAGMVVQCMPATVQPRRLHLN